MDSPSILPTDIIPIVNFALSQSFAWVQSSKKAIALRGWGPLNYNLLSNKQIQPTMTNDESIELCSMLKIQSDASTNNHQLLIPHY